MIKPTRFLWVMLLIGVVFFSCSRGNPPITITQYTDPTHVVGIVPFQDAIYCATKGGLIKWELPDSKYTVYTTADGLPSNVLTDIIVDGEGRLWIGTVAGLCEFDGTSWKSYGLSQGLPSLEITDLSVDTHGSLWVGTIDGVATFKRGRLKILDDEDGPGRQAINDIYFDNGNNVWIGTQTYGIYFKAEGKWHHSTASNGLINNTILTIAQSWDNSIWAASMDGIVQFDSAGWKLHTLKKNLGTFGIRYMTASGERFWYFTPNGVHAYKGAEWIHFTEKDGLISNEVTCGLVVSDEEVYVGTVDGMSVIKNGIVANYFIPNSPVGYNCISLSIDDRKRVWLGTWETGVNIFDSGYWVHLRGKEDKMLATVRNMVFKPDGGIIFNTLGGVIFKDDKGWVIQNRMNGISGDDVRCGVFDSKGRYWIGTATGICYLENGRWKRIRSIHGIPSEDTWTCIIGKDDTIWFGTTGGIVSITEDMLSDRTPEIGLDNIDVRSIAVANDRIYFGTNNGNLIVYNNGTWNIHGDKYLNTDKGITSIAVEPSGALWLGTNGDGIIRLENGKTSRFTITDGLPSNYVRDLKYTGNTLWMSCYGGAATLVFREKGE